MSTDLRAGRNYRSTLISKAASARAEGTFARLLAPVTVADFFGDYWETQPLHVSRAAPGYHDNVLRLSALDEYFQAGNLNPSFLRVVKSNVDCELETWTVIEKRKNTDPYRVVLTEKLFWLFCSGATLIINAAQTAIPSLKSWCTDLQRELEIAIQSNIYITPPQGEGFGFHYDPHDVFILQISGSKRWRLYDYDVRLPVTTEPLAISTYEGATPQQTIDLQAGDLLYLPRGTVHYASTSNEASIHVTVALMSHYKFNLLEDLALIAREHENFRRALPHGFSNPKRRESFIEEFTTELRNLVQQLDIKRLLDNNRAAVRTQPINNRSRFSDLVLLGDLTLDSIVSRRHETDFQLDQNESDLIIKFAQQQFLFPSFMLDSLNSVLQDRPIIVGEIRGLLSDAGKLEFVKTLVQAGLLTIERV
jgi:ribosomal protein L16 Arg81 hydroxylase